MQLVGGNITLEETMEPVELTSFDRCDVNRVEQARVVWIKPTKIGKNTGEHLTLMFCKHHSEKYSDALGAQGFEILEDGRADLTKRAVGAEVS